MTRPFERKAISASDVCALDLERIKRKTKRVPGSRCQVWTGAVTCGSPQCWLSGTKDVAPTRRVLYAVRHGRIEANERIVATCSTDLCVTVTHLRAVSHSLMMRNARGSSPEALKQLRREYKRGATIHDLVDATGLRYERIRDYVRNLDFPDPSYTPPPKSRDAYQRKLTVDDVKSARKSRRAGASLKTIADEFNVAYSTAWAAVHGNTYAHVGKPVPLKSRRR